MKPLTVSELLDAAKENETVVLVAKYNESEPVGNVAIDTGEFMFSDTHEAPLLNASYDARRGVLSWSTKDGDYEVLAIDEKTELKDVVDTLDAGFLYTITKSMT